MLSAQAIRADSSRFSLGGVDSNSRDELPSWQENREQQSDCALRIEAGGEQQASRGLGLSSSLFILRSEIQSVPPVWAASMLHKEGRQCGQVMSPGEAEVGDGPGEGGEVCRVWCLGGSRIWVLQGLMGGTSGWA